MIIAFSEGLYLISEISRDNFQDLVPQSKH